MASPDLKRRPQGKASNSRSPAYADADHARTMPKGFYSTFAHPDLAGRKEGARAGKYEVDNNKFSIFESTSQDYPGPLREAYGQSSSVQEGNPSTFSKVAPGEARTDIKARSAIKRVSGLRRKPINSKLQLAKNLIGSARNGSPANAYEQGEVSLHPDSVNVRMKTQHSAHSFGLQHGQAHLRNAEPLKMSQSQQNFKRLPGRASNQPANCPVSLQHPLMRSSMQAFQKISRQEMSRQATQ